MFTKKESTSEKLKKISEYWNDKNTVSLLDVNLKNLEINVFKKSLKSNYNVLDVGCGDGQTACELSKFVKNIVGIDNSDIMLKKARTRIQQKKFKNVTFKKYNILDLGKIEEKFDVIISNRSITNLPSWKLQKEAILAIKSLLKKNGKYVFLENMEDGWEKMNAFRKIVNLKSIPKHWHNTYLQNKPFLDFISKHFSITESHNFGLYYFLTRVYTPMYAPFVGFGKNAKADPTFKKSDKSAYVLFLKLNNNVTFLDNEFFGPINGYTLQKK